MRLQGRLIVLPELCILQSKKAKDCHWHELSLPDSAADEFADQSEEDDDYMNDWKKIYDRIRELTTRRDEIED